MENGVVLDWINERGQEYARMPLILAPDALEELVLVRDTVQASCEIIQPVRVDAFEPFAGNPKRSHSSLPSSDTSA